MKKLLSSAVVILGVCIGAGGALYYHYHLSPVVPYTDDPQSIQKLVNRLPKSFAEAVLPLHEGKPQVGTDGLLHEYDPKTGVRAEEGLLIYDLCRRSRAKRTLEVGFAIGTSTLYFLAALQAGGGGHHTAIDPYESTEWKGIGLQKVREVAAEGNFRCIEDYSNFALPALHQEGKRFDVIFIDGSHLYDQALVDFTLADQICVRGGYILLHDPWMPSIRKVVSFIDKNRKDYIREPVPVSNMIGFRKVADDQRPVTYFVNF